ncbi:DUF1572 domain-containing protein [Pontibacter sp. FD36]|uniref:DUF1572 domain-containing protein n=1 Tax=Pontibacter sp. FD36 TaxID=2789860 RepID=UPI0018AA91B1|nr:DUF1572 domain-containing protein [Pontibacter sp. FD36]MBF8964084.1 DUF1572 domain-containing protein [Pontibacter sp. FD36]
MKTTYLSSLIKQLEYYKMLGEKAMAQVPDDMLFWQYNAESNSIAVIVNHLAGNMRSRFTDFLTTDGEKPWRNRDAEFENKFTNRAEVMACWESGWQCLLQAVGQLQEEELERIVYIRNDGHTVTEALNRQLAHYPYHIGQIVYLAKMVQDGQWASLSIPRNRSTAYNERKFTQHRGRRHFTEDL